MDEKSAPPALRFPQSKDGARRKTKTIDYSPDLSHGDSKLILRNTDKSMLLRLFLADQRYIYSLGTISLCPYTVGLSLTLSFLLTFLV
ncbi:MAG: hypothetical protein WBA93_21845, partial [Microcoleaceae cyanobacterium]